jgi:hypothetical protein
MGSVDIEDLLSEILFLREWVAANTRRLDDLESSAFVLEEAEEVILVSVPKNVAPPK